MFSVDGSTHMAREIHFRPELFQYNDAGVDTKQLEGQTDLGFAGFRVFKAPELARRDIVAFLGASYFRAVGKEGQYGQSARGLAIDTGMGRPEEFPDFIAYYLEQPAAGSDTLVVYGLLAHAAQRAILGSPRVLNWMQKGFAAVFASLGINLALSDR